MTLADSIRQYARDRMVTPCRDAGVHGFSIRAGDLHSAMGLKARVPAVCAALGSRKFQEQNGLELERVEGPYNGANTTFYFRLSVPAAPSRTEAAAPAEPAAPIEPHPERETTGGAADRLYLVACVSGKRDAPTPARELYTSDWFRKARAYVEATEVPWFILSAEHGLVQPDTVISPYERTLNSMSARERRDWADRVREQMDAVLPDADEIVLLAGERYRELLMDYLRARSRRLSVPMEGMRIGEQLRWLAAAGAAGSAVPSSGADRRAGMAGSLGEMAQRLLALNDQIDREVFFPTVEEGAAELVLDDPYAFLFATCLDRGTKSEIIWTIPWWLHQRWGHFDPVRVRAMSRETLLEAVTAMPRRPRYLTDAPVTIEELTRIVVDEYGGDARALWYRRKSTEFRRTLERIRGVGPGIASMAIQLVDRAFPGEMEESATDSLDIKADVHTRRVLYRLGIADAKSDAAAIAAARQLRPEHPGEVDGPLWYIGRLWCHPDRPNCAECFMSEVCQRRDVG